MIMPDSVALPEDNGPINSRRSLEARVEVTSEERRVFANYFRDIDRDGDDELTAYELKIGLHNLGLTGITDSTVRRMMREADKNEDGVVDFDEFCQVCGSSDACVSYEEYEYFTSCFLSVQICKKAMDLSPEWKRVQKRVLADLRTDKDREEKMVPFEIFGVGDKCLYKNILTCVVIDKFMVF